MKTIIVNMDNVDELTQTEQRLIRGGTEKPAVYTGFLNDAGYLFGMLLKLF